jgi:hypothetical protein
VADIEGRTGCWHDKDAAFMTMEWIRTGTAMAPWMKTRLNALLPRFDLKGRLGMVRLRPRLRRMTDSPAGLNSRSPCNNCL